MQSNAVLQHKYRALFSAGDAVAAVRGGNPFSQLIAAYTHYILMKYKANIHLVRHDQGLPNSLKNGLQCRHCDSTKSLNSTKYLASEFLCLLSSLNSNLMEIIDSQMVSLERFCNRFYVFRDLLSKYCTMVSTGGGIVSVLRYLVVAVSIPTSVMSSSLLL